MSSFRFWILTICFNKHLFPWWHMILNIFFTYLVDIFSFFGKVSIKIFGLFKNQIVGSYCSILKYFVCYGWLPRWNSGKKSTCQWRGSKRCGFETWVGKSPWSRKWQPTPVLLPGKFQGQRRLAATVQEVAEHQTWPSDWAEIFWILFVYQTCLLQILSPGLWLIFSFSS